MSEAEQAREPQRETAEEPQRDAGQDSGTELKTESQDTEPESQDPEKKLDTEPESKAVPASEAELKIRCRAGEGGEGGEACEGFRAGRRWAGLGAGARLGPRWRGRVRGRCLKSAPGNVPQGTQAHVPRAQGA